MAGYESCVENNDYALKTRWTGDLTDQVCGQVCCRYGAVDL